MIALCRKSSERAVDLRCAPGTESLSAEIDCTCSNVVPGSAEDGQAKAYKEHLRSCDDAPITTEAQLIDVQFTTSSNPLHPTIGCALGTALSDPLPFSSKAGSWTEVLKTLAFCATHWTSRTLNGAYPEYVYAMSLSAIGRPLALECSSSESSTIRRSDRRRAEKDFELGNGEGSVRASKVEAVEVLVGRGERRCRFESEMRRGR